MSYPDFVAFIGQRNTPPGSLSTLESWVAGSAITATSRVLDVACSTGFSSRVATLATGCRARGFDVSWRAVREARREARLARVSSRLDYFVGDVTKIALRSHQFTHALAGCCFGFFSDRERALDEVVRVIVPGGYLCTANFYMTGKPSRTLLREVEREVGFAPKPAGWERWRVLFERKLALEGIEHRQLPVLSDEQLVETVRASVLAGCRRRRVPVALHEACVDRMTCTRRVLNRMRAHQAHSIEIWRSPS
jgi:SAM-dependent methyltransferase